MTGTCIRWRTSGAATIAAATLLAASCGRGPRRAPRGTGEHESPERLVGLTGGGRDPDVSFERSSWVIDPEGPATLAPAGRVLTRTGTGHSPDGMLASCANAKRDVFAALADACAAIGALGVADHTAIATGCACAQDARTGETTCETEAQASCARELADLSVLGVHVSDRRVVAEAAAEIATDVRCFYAGGDAAEPTVACACEEPLHHCACLAAARCGP